ncbi:MAG: helix-turn-helix domain-containing protein [Bacillota bacterium]
MEQVLGGKLTIRQAAELLDLSKRQVKRLKGGMKKEGVAFLAHKNRGRKPEHALPQEIRDQIIALALGDYHDASCAHMAELLAEYQEITVSPRTIQRIFTQAGIPKRHAPKTRRIKPALDPAERYLEAKLKRQFWEEVYSQR